MTVKPTRRGVVIVGAGVQGMFCALDLADSGSEDITVIDRRQGSGGLSSSRSASMLTRITMDAYLSELAHKSIGLYEGLDDRYSGAAFKRYLRRTGFAVVARDPLVGTALTRHNADLRVLGCNTYWATAEDVAEASSILLVRDDPPALLTEGSHCLVCEDDGWIDLDGLLNELRIQCEARGAMFRLGETVTDIGVSAANEVETVRVGDDLLDCGAVVNAAGISAGEVAKMVGRGITIDASIKNLVFVRGAYLEGPIVESLDDGYYFRPAPRGVWVGVGFGETKSPAFVAQNLEPNVETDRLEDCRDYLRENTSISRDLIAAIDAGECHAGYRPMPAAGFATSDRTSTIPPSFGHPEETPHGYFESAGWGEFGITLGPVGGKLVADAVREYLSC